jgi:iron complex outermembrane receptor protein
MTPHTRLTTLSAAIASALLSLSAQAQDQQLDTVDVTDAGVPFRQFRGVEVTGTAIINPTARQALPVRVIDRREIERTGATNVVQLLQRLPLMHSFTELGGYNSIGKGGYQSGAIHGYEAGTLILINGRRQAAVPLQRADLDRTAADIGLLPLSAIDRVEILTDGASSLYGSEAIAGVINIITREQTQGLRISAEASEVTTANSQGNGLGLAWGTGNLLKDRYNIQVHFSTNRQDPVAANSLPWTSHTSVPIGTNANGDPIIASPLLSIFGYPGKIYRLADTADQCADGYDHTLLAQSTSYLGAPVYTCQYAPYGDLYLYPRIDNRRLHAQVEWVTNAQHAIFAEWTRQEQDTQYLRASTINDFITNPSGQTVVFNLYPWFPLQRSISLERDRYVLGSKGLVGDWNYRLSFMASDNRETVTDTGGISATNARVRSTLAPFHAELLKPFGEGSPAFLQALESLRRTDDSISRVEKSELRELNLTASRTLGETEWGDIQLAAVGFATEQLMAVNSPSAPTTSPAYAASRRNHGLASEIQWPALAALHLTGALRAERYSDVGSVLTGKLGAKYQISDHTFVRASTGTGFRAPTLAQMAAVASRRSAGTDLNGVYREIWAEGNPDLRPETSVQQSIGIQSNPSHNWALGLDWWHFKVDDVFGSLSIAEIDSDPTLRARYFRNGNYYLQPLNLGQLNKSGIDYNVQYRHPLDKGVLAIKLEGTHHLRSQRNLSAGQGSVSDLGNYQTAFDSVTPRNKLRLSATITNPQLGWNAAINYQSGNTEPLPYTVLEPNGRQGAHTGSTRQVRSHITLDVGGWYQIQQRLRLVWNIENITNATPPLRLYNNNQSTTTGSMFPWSDTRYNDYRGRVFTARLEWQLW